MPASLGLRTPGVPIVLCLGKAGLKQLDLGMQLARVDGQLHALILHVRELLTQLRVLDRDGEEVGGSLVVHATLARLDVGPAGLPQLDCGRYLT